MMAAMVVTAVVVRLDSVAAVRPVSMLLVRRVCCFGMATVRAMSMLLCAVTV
jgi:hypothetical protein